jgi:hypothetical protein
MLIRKNCAINLKKNEWVYFLIEFKSDFFFFFQALERYYGLLVKDVFKTGSGNLSMPIKAPCQPGQGPEIEINPAIFLESSCLEFIEGHEQMEEYLTKMAKEGGYTSLDLTTNSKRRKHLALAFA